MSATHTCDYDDSTWEDGNVCPQCGYDYTGVYDSAAEDARLLSTIQPAFFCYACLRFHDPESCADNDCSCCQLQEQGDNLPTDDMAMSVAFTKDSVLTGVRHTRILPTPQVKLEAFLVGRAEGNAEVPFVQVAFPELSAEDREFIMTGTTTEEWASAFGPLADD